jgi:hypothetical protein
MSKQGKRESQRPSAGKKRIGKRSLRREIPNKASIISTETFTSPKGRRYTILETDQTDAYDDPKGTVQQRRPN